MAGEKENMEKQKNQKTHADCDPTRSGQSGGWRGGVDGWRGGRGMGDNAAASSVGRFW